MAAAYQGQGRARRDADYGSTTSRLSPAYRTFGGERRDADGGPRSPPQHEDECRRDADCANGQTSEEPAQITARTAMAGPLDAQVGGPTVSGHENTDSGGGVWATTCR